MSDRAEIARQAAEALRAFAPELPDCPAMVGFDGFVDSIIDVVDKRQDADNYQPLATISDFGDRVQAAAGKSANFEVIVKLQKLGGNGPIMANALTSLGAPTTYIGALGYPNLHPAFAEMAERTECLPIADPGQTNALEFTDGKLMLGNQEILKDVSWQSICDIIGEERFREILRRSRLVSMVNWTMLAGMNDIWHHLIDSVLSREDNSAGGQQTMFVDFADPEKRTREDLAEALRLCTKLQQRVDVVLGMNLSEAVQVAKVLDIDPTDDPESALEPIAVAIRERLELSTVVVHPRSGAAAADANEGSAYFAGPLVAIPKISTGAGDHFNSGFALSRMAGLTLSQALAAGTATSGYYVRNAASPTLEQLTEFLTELPPPEA